MKWVKEFALILLISFVGECLHAVVPLPIPASIYGIALLFAGLESRVIPLEAVKGASSFLIEIMPILFIPAAVGLMDAWDILRPVWLPYLVIMVVSTVVVMAAAGRATQAVMRRRAGKEGAGHE
ncbi:MAG: CidA/LrgA family protein [Eubacteriales bacterium]|nr:CidA/LrgA family protein [Eubacteriales bacterium]